MQFEVFSSQMTSEPEQSSTDAQVERQAPLRHAYGAQLCGMPSASWSISSLMHFVGKVTQTFVSVLQVEPTAQESLFVHSVAHESTASSQVNGAQLLLTDSTQLPIPSQVNTVRVEALHFLSQLLPEG
jgi:hypothetical protein